MSLRRVIGGFSALAAATLGAQVVAFFVLTVVTRRISDDDLGSFYFALNLGGYFAIPANFGLTALGVREIARAPEQARRIAGEVLALQGILTLVSYAAFVALSGVLAPDTASEAVIPIVGMMMIFDALSLHWVLQGTQRLTVLALGRLAGNLATALLTLAFVHDGAHAARNLAWATLAGSAVTALILGWSVLRNEGPPARVRLAARDLAWRFRASFPLGFSFAMIAVYYSIDSVLLGYMKDTATVGQYSVAYKIPLALITFTAMWSSALYPHASALAVAGRELLRDQLGLLVSVTVAVALPIAVSAAIVSDRLMPELFGQTYAPAGAPFSVLMIATAMVFVAVTLGTALLALDGERAYAVAVTLGAFANVAVNVVVIPAYGMTGAAWATVLAEVIVTLYVGRQVYQRLGALPLGVRRIAGGVGASATMAAVMIALPKAWSASVVLFSGIVVYLAAALALRVVTFGDVRQLRSVPDTSDTP